MEWASFELTHALAMYNMQDLVANICSLKAFYWLKIDPSLFCHNRDTFFEQFLDLCCLRRLRKNCSKKGSRL